MTGSKKTESKFASGAIVELDDVRSALNTALPVLFPHDLFLKAGLVRDHSEKVLVWAEKVLDLPATKKASYELGPMKLTLWVDDEDLSS